MRENEKTDKPNEPLYIYVENSFWSKFGKLPWFGIVLTTVIVLFLSGVGFLIYASFDAYRSECHQVGGHIIDVKDTEICVDRENRVIFL